MVLCDVSEILIRAEEATSCDNEISLEVNALAMQKQAEHGHSPDAWLCRLIVGRYNTHADIGLSATTGNPTHGPL